MKEYLGLPLLEFESKDSLRNWLMANHTVPNGVWVRVFKVGSTQASVGFEDLLDQGLCFGWSESLRHACDEASYLQKFTSRKSKGTTSKRNLARARKLIASGEMTPDGLVALGLSAQ
jgi:uncharacterized protein YdeI (YjbR/CyaY-like superfamily)